MKQKVVLDLSYIFNIQSMLLKKGAKKFLENLSKTHEIIVCSKLPQSLVETLLIEQEIKEFITEIKPVEFVKSIEGK